jgi:hypothetical protein
MTATGAAMHRASGICSGASTVRINLNASWLCPLTQLAVLAMQLDEGP